MRKILICSVGLLAIQTRFRKSEKTGMKISHGTGASLTLQSSSELIPSNECIPNNHELKIDFHVNKRFRSLINIYAIVTNYVRNRCRKLFVRLCINDKIVLIGKWHSIRKTFLVARLPIEIF